MVRDPRITLEHFLFLEHNSSFFRTAGRHTGGRSVTMQCKMWGVTVWKGRGKSEMSRLRRRQEVVSCLLRSYDDVVNGDVDKFDEESDEAHDREPDGGGNGNLLELWNE